MTTAHQIAMDALAEAERPERERREAEEKVRKAASDKKQRAWKRGTAKLLRESPLEKWFPGVQWLLDDQESYGEPYVQTPTGPGTAFIDQPYNGQNGSEIIRVVITDKSVYAAAHADKGLVRVRSTAEIGKYFRDYWDRYYASMPDHLP